MGRPNRQRNRQMHPATCSECGNSCEVPFKPTGDKPVYCNECFKKIKGGGKKDFGQPRKDGSPEQKPSDHSHKEHARIHAKLDQILKMLQGMDLPKEANEAKKAPAKKTVKKVAPKKTVTKKTTAKKTVTKKAATKKATAKKTATKKKTTKAKKK